MTPQDVPIVDSLTRVEELAEDGSSEDYWRAYMATKESEGLVVPAEDPDTWYLTLFGSMVSDLGLTDALSYN